MKTYPFSRTVLVLSMTLLLLDLRTAETFADSQESRATLKGLPGISVDAILIPSCETAGLYKESVKIEAELQLRQAGIKVLDQGPPTLGIHLVCHNMREPARGYFFSVWVTLSQTIRWPYSPSSFANVITWESLLFFGGSDKICVSACAGWTPSRQSDREHIRDRINEFINAWLSVNPVK